MSLIEWRVRQLLNHIRALPVRTQRRFRKPSSMAADVYLANGHCIVCAVTPTFDGLSLALDPDVIPSPVTAELLERAINQAFGRSRRYVRMPRGKQWDSSFKPFLHAADVRSLKSFMAGAKLVSLRQEGGMVEVMPNDNLGPKGGFQGRPDDLVIIPADEPRKVAQAVMRLLFDQ